MVKAARKKSVVLKKATRATPHERLMAEREILVGLKLHLKGYKDDLKEAKISARIANKALSVAERAVDRQNKAVARSVAKIDKLRAA